MECDQAALPFLVSFDFYIYMYIRGNKNSINLEILININVFNRAEGKLGRPNWASESVGVRATKIFMRRRECMEKGKQEKKEKSCFSNWIKRKRNSERLRKYKKTNKYKTKEEREIVKKYETGEDMIQEKKKKIRINTGINSGIK